MSSHFDPERPATDPNRRPSEHPDEHPGGHPNAHPSAARDSGLTSGLSVDDRAWCAIVSQLQASAPKEADELLTAGEPPPPLPPARLESMVAFALAEHSVSERTVEMTPQRQIRDRFEQLIRGCGIAPEATLQELSEALAARGGEHDVCQLVAELVRSGAIRPYSAEGAEPFFVLGDYVALGEIGAGGMGQVYRALQLPLDRLVALKILPPHATLSQANVQRFEREMRTLARLQHAHITAAYDAGLIAGVRYLVMEYVDGGDLSRLVRRVGPLSVRLALEFVQQAARGLEYAHAQNIVHRDIKPSNLLLDGGTRIKISDLGLARLFQRDNAEAAGETEADVTADGAALGTYSYIAPEQTSNARGVDQRADIYSLGCTLYYLLLGRSPARGSDSIEKINWHRQGPIPSLRELRADVPYRLDAVFQRMLARDPDQRYQSAGELLIALQRCREELLVGADAQSTVTSAWLDSEEASADSPVAESTVRNPETARDPAHPQPGPTTRGRSRLQTAVLVAVAAAGTLGLVWVLGGFLGWQAGAGRTGDSNRRVPRPGAETDKSVSNGQSPASAKRPVAAAASPTSQPADPNKGFINSVGIRFVSIPPGQFLMGAPESEPGSETHERPRHLVELPRYHLGATEVTRGQFRRLHPEHTLPPLTDYRAGDRVQPDSLPITHVTWEEAVRFCRALSKLKAEQMAGRAYRLPTEAEWEYACRAESPDAYAFGKTIAADQANVGALAEPPDVRFPRRPRLLEVGSFVPNQLGLYDMHGNVSEWCSDWYGRYRAEKTFDPQGAVTGRNRVVRGGAYNFHAREARSAARMSFRPRQYRSQYVGFRVACDLGRPAVRERKPKKASIK